MDQQHRPDIKRPCAKMDGNLRAQPTIVIMLADGFRSV